MGKTWVPKSYALFAVLGELDVFGKHLRGRPSLRSSPGHPPDCSPEVLQAVEEMSEDDDIVRHVGLKALLEYGWDEGETIRFLAGALGFHQFETTGETNRLLNAAEETRAKQLGLREVTNEQMRAIIRDRPEVLNDLVESAAGAFTFVDTKATAAKELGFAEGLQWLQSLTPPASDDDARVTMIMSV